MSVSYVFERFWAIYVKNRDFAKKRRRFFAGIPTREISVRGSPRSGRLDRSRKTATFPSKLIGGEPRRGTEADPAVERRRSPRSALSRDRRATRTEVGGSVDTFPYWIDWALSPRVFSKASAD